MKILLVGFYGHGNFGDDVLFKVTHRLVRSWFPDATIAVQSEAPSPDYLPALAEEPLPIVRLGEKHRVDLAVHGGGGNFFDFTDGTARHAAINRVAGLLGPHRFASLTRFLRSVTGKTGIVANRRVALGLGIGTYAASAIRLLHELPVLAAMDFLGVRDAGSVRNLATLGLHHAVHRSGDLAFAGGWGDQVAPSGRSDAITVVLRDWSDEAVNRAQLDSLTAIAAKRSVRVVLLDREADRALLPSLAEYEVISYEPGEFAPVIAALAEAPAIVTSRAHGAICGAMLGTPSLLLPIEPKLRAVHAMLPASTVILDPVELLDEPLDRVLAISPKAIVADVTSQRALLDSAIINCRRLLHN